MYNNLFTSELTTAETTLLQNTLSLYEELTVDSCGDVNILGIDLKENETAEQHADRIEHIVSEMQFKLVRHHVMSDFECESLWGMLQDAIDQYDITNGEIGALNTENDRIMSIHICELIRK